MHETLLEELKVLIRKHEETRPGEDMGRMQRKVAALHTLVEEILRTFTMSRLRVCDGKNIYTSAILEGQITSWSVRASTIAGGIE